MEISKKALREVCWDADIDFDSVRTDYSGRGMYNRTCFGIVGALADFTRFMVCLAGLEQALWHDKVMVMADSVCTDSMGLDTIFYFPHVTVVNDEESE